MIKLIATDVDGTLVKDGTMTINPEYMTVIRKLTELGITFVVCSGRQYDSERKLFEPVKDLVYFVSDGGTVIRKNGKILKVHTLPDEVWKRMHHMVKEKCRNVTALLPHRSVAMRRMRMEGCSGGCGISMVMI